MPKLPRNLFNDDDDDAPLADRVPPKPFRVDGSTGAEEDQLSPIDLLEIPTELADIVRLILRSGALTLAEIAAEVNQPLSLVETRVKILINDGILRQSQRGGETHYKAKLGRVGQRKRMSDVWSALDDL
jgi:hypothetical protein